MLKIEKFSTHDWESAVYGMRTQMNSWSMSDSHRSDFTDDGKDGFIVGPDDLALMKELAVAGSIHAKYRRTITVYLDVIAPLYWWKEFDTYKVGTGENSCLTMHKIHAKEFSLDDFSHDHLLTHAETELRVTPLSLLNATIDCLNDYRERFLETGDKKWWWQMVQLLPSSYNQRRTVMLSYEVLAGIYPMRKNHKLDEWKEFCKWIESLPYSELITI